MSSNSISFTVNNHVSVKNSLALMTSPVGLIIEEAGEDNVSVSCVPPSPIGEQLVAKDAMYELFINNDIEVKSEDGLSTDDLFGYMKLQN